VVKARNRLPSSLGRGVNLGLYTVAAYGTLVTYRDKRIQLECDGEAEDFYGSYVVVANGRYFADGMFIAPSARLDDGRLNLVTIGSITRARLQMLAMAAYRGEHLKFPEVREKTATSVAIECGEKLYVEADGELLGACPAAFSVIPSALKVTVLPELRSSDGQWSRLIQRIKEQSGVPGVSTG
jgi:diacylglycerol kinase family enzyme